MEEALAVSPAAPKSLQELAMEGQKALEATVEAAHETLASMNEVLCNPALWSTSSSSIAATNSTSGAIGVTPASSSSGAAAQLAGSASAAGDSTELTASRIDASKTGAEGLAQQEAGWAALEDARLRLRSSAGSLRSVITSVFSSSQMREQEDPSNSLSDKSDPAEVEKLEQQVLALREEVKNKNKVVKLLIDQLRELINDISMWQSPGL
eukprot:c9586_g1_i1 orf=591-1220(-)